MHVLYSRILLILCAAFLAGCAAPSQSGRTAGSGRLTERDRVVRLQIFLDERNFGPGIIDGQWGLYTDKARARHLAMHGMAFDSQWERTMGVDQIGQLYTAHTVTSADAARIGAVAATPPAPTAPPSPRPADVAVSGARQRSTSRA